MSWFGEALEGVREAFDFVSGANDVVVVRYPPGAPTPSPHSRSHAPRPLVGRGVGVRRGVQQRLVAAHGAAVFQLQQ